MNNLKSELECSLLETVKKAVQEGVTQFGDLDPEVRNLILHGSKELIDEVAGIAGFSASEAQKTVNRYWLEVVCSYCNTPHAYNLLNGVQLACPYCQRESDTFGFHPPTIATWLKKIYHFANIIESDCLYVYDEDTGKWDCYAEQLSKAELDKVAHRLMTTHKVNETIAAIKAGSMVHIDTFAGATLQTNDDVKFNLKNGVYSLKEGKLLPHDPSYHFLGQLPVKYNPNAKPTRILKFIEEVTEPHYDSYFMMLEHAAFTLCPGYHIQKAIMYVGSGGNGKSTWLKFIKAFLGQSNISSITLQQLDKERFLRAGLFGKMANISADIPKDALKYTGFFKMTTGGDLITAENKNKNPFQFMSTAKQLYSANEIPISEDKSLAFFERWSIVELFKEFREGENDDTNLINKLVTEEELAGFFNLAICIMPILLHRTKFTFDRTSADTEALYKERSNSAESFVETCLKSDTSSQLLSKEIVQAYNNYCSANGLLQETDKRLFSTLKDSTLHFEKRHKREEGVDKWYYVGIALVGKEQQAILKESSNGADRRQFESLASAWKEYVARNTKYDVQHLQLLQHFCVPGFLQDSEDNKRVRENAVDAVNPIDLHSPTIIIIPEILNKVQKTLSILSTSQGILTTEAVEFKVNGSPSSYEKAADPSFICTSRLSGSVTTYPLGYEASPISVSYGDGAARELHTSPPGQPINAKPLYSGGAQVVCPSCGSSTGTLWEVAGKWMCVDCLNKIQHADDDIDITLR